MPGMELCLSCCRAKRLFLSKCVHQMKTVGGKLQTIKEQNHLLEGFEHLRSAAKQLSLNYETGAQENIYLACNIFLYRKL